MVSSLHAIPCHDATDAVLVLGRSGLTAGSWNGCTALKVATLRLCASSSIASTVPLLFISLDFESHLKYFGGVPVLWKHRRTAIVASRTIEISTKVHMSSMPRTGMAFEDSGSESGTMSKKTIMPSRSVVTKPILSPLSDGIQKLTRVRMDIIKQGATI